MTTQGNIKTKKAATLYIQSKLGNIYKVEAREVEVLRRQFDKWPSAVDCHFKAPNKKNWHRYRQGYRPYLVILDGWGHPNPPPEWIDIKEDSECSVSQTRHSSCSEQWIANFDVWLSNYLKNNPSVKVLGDYRYTTGCNTHDLKAKVEYDNQQINSIGSQLRKIGVPRNLAIKIAELYFKKSPNRAAGALNEKGFSCTIARGKLYFPKIETFIEPEKFFEAA